MNPLLKWLVSWLQLPLFKFLHTQRLAVPLFALVPVLDDRLDAVCPFSATTVLSVCPLHEQGWHVCEHVNLNGDVAVKPAVHSDWDNSSYLTLLLSGPMKTASWVYLMYTNLWSEPPIRSQPDLRFLEKSSPWVISSSGCLCHLAWSVATLLCISSDALGGLLSQDCLLLPSR